MGAILDIIVTLLLLIWLGLMVINAYNLLDKKGKTYRAKNTGMRLLVIIPCKGKDLTLADNLLSVKRQDYRNYGVVAVVDSEDDEAVPEIRRAGIKWILASKRFERCSGKVAAISTVLQRFRNYDAYAIIDSDVCCKRNHIGELVAPLADKRVGISTAYPYFNPMGGFWSKVKMVWGFVGNGMMESRVTRFGWGGSIAFRKDLLSRPYSGIFAGAVSDDMALVHASTSKGLRIEYVNKGTVTVNVDDSFSGFLEWSNRQTALSILGSRKVLWMGLAFYGASCLLLLSGILLPVFASPIYAIFLVPFFIGLYKTYRRSRRKYLSIIPIYLVMNFIFLANLFAASRMRSIEWRGRRYALRNPF